MLELATGTGLIAKHIVNAAAHIEATDASAEMIAEAKRDNRSAKLHFSVQDMFRLPYAEESFDVVIVSNALHIVPQPEKALAEIQPGAERRRRAHRAHLYPRGKFVSRQGQGIFHEAGRLPSPQQVDERGIPALPAAERLDGAEKRCSESLLPADLCGMCEIGGVICHFFENTRKPVGFGGKIMVAMMNLGHSPVARWGLQFLNAAPDAKVLDCGCGGGANIKRLLKKCPEGIVKGIDYSPVSVEKSKKVNEAAIAEGRCTVLQGSVADMIFAGDWFDAVTAFETVYFWPDLPQCFREVYRVLKPGGTLLICNESNGDTDKDKKWTEIIGGMTIYKDAELKTYLEQAGFHEVQIHKKKSWLCITAWK